MRWSWIHGRNQDLIWYVGSALAGWGYVALVLWVGGGLEDPIREPFYELRLGRTTVPLTLGLLVIASWAVLIDAPHLWATLARTLLDPDEWAERRGVLLTSLLFFALGPAAVLSPYVVGAFVPLPSAWTVSSQALFFLLFRLWAYYHVVRQHWGFLVLYKRANDDVGVPLEDRADWWFFNAALYLPLLIFVSAPWYASTGMPDLGLGRPIWGRHTLAVLLHAVSGGAFAVVPLHLLVFIHPLLALFVVPVVTVGHNLQYHRIVWVYGRKKYRGAPERRFRWARAAFGSIPAYAALGLVFTLVFYRGPFVDLVEANAAHVLNRWLAAGLGTIAGTEAPDPGNLGAQVVATFLLGWAMQHYYLDSKIWRVRRDERLARNLET